MKSTSFNTNIFSKRSQSFEVLGGTNLRRSGGPSSFLFWRRPSTLALSPKKWTPNRRLRRYTLTQTSLECPSPRGITMECNFFIIGVQTWPHFYDTKICTFHFFTSLWDDGHTRRFLRGRRRRGGGLLLNSHTGMYRPYGYRFWAVSVWKRV